MRTRAALFLAVLTVWLAAPVQAQTRIEAGRATGAGGISLRIMNLEGSVRVTGWDRDSIAVTGALAGAATRAFYLAGEPGGTGFRVIKVKVIVFGW